MSETPAVRETPDGSDVLVFRAGPPYRIVAVGGMVVLAILAWRVAVSYGFTATIAIVFAIGIAFFLYWGVLRPKLVAGPNGVEVVLGRTPTTIAWKDIRRCEAAATGLTITASGGTQVQSRWPQRDRGAKLTDVTEADRVAAYIVSRAEWARRPKGPAPVFVPTPPAPKDRTKGKGTPA